MRLLLAIPCVLVFVLVATLCTAGGVGEWATLRRGCPDRPRAEVLSTLAVMVLVGAFCLWATACTIAWGVGQ